MEEGCKNLREMDIAEKTYGNPVNPCKHLQCIQFWVGKMLQQFVSFMQLSYTKDQRMSVIA